MHRRSLLKSFAAGGAALAAPSLVRAVSQSILNFVPQSDLASLDPVWTTADVTRNFAAMVYDTLYGLDDHFLPHPQMVAGHTTSADGKQWDLTLRDGLKFHDGSPVLARDCVTSIQRWGKRDIFGGRLMAVTDEISAPSDKVIRFRLKQPFPLLPMALATNSNTCVMMPERLAKTDPMKQVTEVVGSGPFRYLPSERVAGSRMVAAKFADYVPRPDGQTSFTAGPKIVHFDRVVWTVVPDPATASAALSAGEYDWWENPIIDLVPSLKQNQNLVVTVTDHAGEIGCLRFNHLYPPFDNPAIRQVVLRATNQKSFMEAVAGSAPELIKTPVGIWAPASPYATDVGVDVMQGDDDPAKLQQALKAAGYKGEKVVVLAASNFPSINAIAEVGADMLKKIGFNLDYQSLDWGTVVQRRASKNPPDKGGWNIFFTFLGGFGNIVPAATIAVASGPNAWFGWPNMPHMAELLNQWFAAPDLKAQQAICRQMQQEAWKDVPYVPTGMYYMPTAYRKNLTGVLEGFPLFYNVRRT